MLARGMGLAPGPPMELVVQRYSWAATLVAAVMAAWLCARTLNTVVASTFAPKPALLAAGPTAPALGLAVAPHTPLDLPRLAKAFDVPLPQKAEDGAAVKAAPKAPSWQSVPARSSLHGVLVGTALATPEKYSLCQVINTDTNETVVYALNERFQNALIYAIERDRILVDNEGRNEYIDNSAAAAPNLGVTPLAPVQPSGGEGVRQLNESQYVVKKAEIDKALTNLSELATQARIVPSFKNGVANGFKLFSIVPDSLYSKIGIQNGDVIRRINGYDMNSPDKALEVYQKLRDANRIEVELERRGDTVKKSYSIE
jgi:general secretion pathway protein C